MDYTTLWRSLATIYDEGEARAIARYVFEDGFGMSAADIYCGRELPEDKATASVVTRLIAGEPVQYVLGETVFCGRRFAVASSVLIPRPETEGLVEHIIQEHIGPAPQILDIGTGSGCIAVTLAKAIKGAEVTAWDISEDALGVAKENAVLNKTNVHFELQDALTPPTDTAKWDIIVSNPPYICNKERKEMEKNVLDFEPHTALFVPDDNPLLFYRAITRYARKALKSNGTLYFEINPLYADDLIEMAKEEGFDYAETFKDCFGKQRFTVIK